MHRIRLNTYTQPTSSALNLVVPVLHDRCSSVYIIVCMLVERCVLTVINEDYYYYYYKTYHLPKIAYDRSVVLNAILNCSRS